MQTRSQAELLRDLQGAVPADQIITDTGERSLYDSDGLCLHRSVPAGIFLACSAGQVQAAVKVFHQHGVACLPRGAGTGLSGGAVADTASWIIDTSPMNAILELNVEDRYARVQPGLVNLRLDEAAACEGLRFAPDPSSQKACTIGGNIAENSGGPHCFRHGMTTRHVLGMTVITVTGQCLTLGGPPGQEDALDWRGLMVGSEGTLGIVVEAVLALVSRPAAVRTALATFSTLAEACRASSQIIARGLRPAALEIIDQPTIQAVEASVLRAGYDTEAGAVLLIEQEGTPESMAAEAGLIGEACQDHGALAFEEARDEAHRLRLWQGRKGAFGAMGRMSRDLYVLDGVVPRKHLATAIEQIQDIGRKYDITLCNVFHAGDGNLHPNLSFDGNDPDARQRALDAGAEILQLCVKLGGTLSGEHGIGLEKKRFMPLVFSPDDLAQQKAVKAVFDPHSRLNPGKIFPDTED